MRLFPEVLINYVSHQVYHHIEENEMYNEAIRELKALYVMMPDQIFASHLRIKHQIFRNIVLAIT